MLGGPDEARINGAYPELTEPAAASAVSTIHQEALMTPKLKRTLALVLAGGSLAIGVPAALAAGGGDAGTTGGTTSAPSFIQDEQQQQPDQARPDRGDCPEKDGAQGGGGDQQGSSGDAGVAPGEAQAL
jgi:hypothetical protein